MQEFTKSTINIGELRARLQKKMSDEELLRFGRAEKFVSPPGNTNPNFPLQLKKQMRNGNADTHANEMRPRRHERQGLVFQSRRIGRPWTGSRLRRITEVTSP